MALKYCVNLSMLYTEHPFLDRFAKAARAGFTAVEYLFPYELDLTEVKARLEHLGLVQVLFNLHAGDTSTGEWGTLANPQRLVYFRWSIAKALEVAQFLNCTRLHVMFGNTVAGIERNVQVECAVENLSLAAPLAAEAGVTLLIEPLNAMDFPTYGLLRTAEALSIIRQVNHPQVKLQYDIYHAQMTEGNLINTITNCLPDIGHIQIADVPGRHQPGTGEINYGAVLEVIRKLNYSGYVGLEYRPSNDSDPSLAWLAREERGRNSGERQ
jgi:hydroxypyruvate isomerase